MTHFTVGIIVPQDKLPEIHDFIASQMEPFNEAKRVEPYVCYSVKEAEADIARDIARLGRIIERQDPAYNLDKCQEHLAKLRQTTPEDRYREYITFHERFNSRGEPISTYNPEGKWDWYRVGGRWDGWITANEQSSDQGFNFGPHHQSLTNNMATTEKALELGIAPHAIVTPDGQWHEHGKLGWFAIMITENDAWDTESKAILARHPGHYLVILDAHI